MPEAAIRARLFETCADGHRRHAPGGFLQSDTRSLGLVLVEYKTGTSYKL